MTRSELVARYFAMWLLLLATLMFPLPGSAPLELSPGMVGISAAVVTLFGVIHVIAAKIHRVWARRDRAVVSLDPVIPTPAPIRSLLQSSEDRAPLQGKVRELRTYSIPEMENVDYYSVLIDVNGDVHELEFGRSFGEIEERATLLATLLAVPFISGI